MARFDLIAEDIERLQKAMIQYEGNVEEVINDIFHNEAGPKMQESIQALIPVSGKQWRGKRPPARTSKSLQRENENLSVTVRTTNPYHYLWFPDDGSNTRRHVGNQQFFYRGAFKVSKDIIDRCVNRLIDEVPN